VQVFVETLFKKCNKNVCQTNDNALFHWGIIKSSYRSPAIKMQDRFEGQCITDSIKQATMYGI